MEHLLFSFQTILPVTLIMLLGFCLRKKGLITDDFISIATTLVFYYALPANLFLNVCDVDFLAIVNGRFIVFMVITTFAIFFAIWFLARLITNEGRQVAAIVHGGFRGNFAYVGLAVIQNILPDLELTAPLLIIAFVIPLYNVLAVFILSYYSGQGRPGIGALLKGIFTNPLILGILAGILVSLLHIPVIAPIHKTLNYLGSMATPLALIFIGANLRLDALSKQKRLVFATTFFKLVLFPLIFTGLAVWLRFGVEAIVTIFVTLSVPAATNTYVMAKKMNGDAELAAGIVASTTVFSILTIPLGLTLLMTLGVL